MVLGVFFVIKVRGIGEINYFVSNYWYLLDEEVVILNIVVEFGI